MKFVITGGAGFVGSNFAKRLLADGHKVTIFDKSNKSKSTRLKPIIKKIDYKQIDLQNLKQLKQKLKNFDVVAHFSASANIGLGKTDTETDFKNGTLVTYNILEAMRNNGIKKIIFPSSSAIYGNFSKIPTPENAGLLFPTSLYGAAKLSSEAMISAFCYLFNMQAWIFRFGNILGPDMTRGVIKDFILKLKKNPHKLKILGNGSQQKDFIYINDCLDGILFAFKKSNDVVNVFNLSTGKTTSVKKISKMVVKEMNRKNVKFTYSGGKSGWPGDAPIVHYDISKIKKLGWKPKLSSDEAVKSAIKHMISYLE